MKGQGGKKMENDNDKKEVVRPKECHYMLVPCRKTKCVMWEPNEVDGYCKEVLLAEMRLKKLFKEDRQNGNR